jgi:hypothetical protein
MDMHEWIIERLEPVVSVPDAPGEVTMAGPGGLLIRAEVDWFEGEGPDSACGGVDAEVSTTGEPVGNFGYRASPDARWEIVNRLEPAQAARVAGAIGRGSTAGLMRQGRASRQSLACHGGRPLDLLPVHVS